jgi:hypothetical protein
MKFLSMLALMMCCRLMAPGQSLLGNPKATIFDIYKDCVPINRYQVVVMFNCANSKSIYYFNGPDSTCDMYVRDFRPGEAKDTIQFLLKQGFKKTETRYVESFLKLKHNDHQKFPSQVYSNDIIQYCFMPVSLNGKSAELNAVIVMYAKKEK